MIKENESSEVHVQSTHGTKRSRLGTIFCRCGNKHGGLAAVEEENARVTIEKGCQIIQSLVQLQITEQVLRCVTISANAQGKGSQTHHQTEDMFRRLC